MTMKVVLVAGGTGGHIYPAVSLARELIKRGHEVTFIGANDRMEKDVIPSLGFKFIGLDVKTTRGGITQKVYSVLSMAQSYRRCLKLLKGNCDMLIGFGNYISVPVVLAARHLGIKTVIHEQNSFVGRANRFLDTKVDLVITSYAESLKQFKNPQTVVLGNPQSSVAKTIVKNPEVISSMGLDPKRKTVVIFMGSLGSESVLNVMLDYFKMLKDFDYQIIYATGVKHFDKAKDYANDQIKIFDKINGAEVMANADLLVSRAGATTLAEITALGTPSILIPSPYVPNNHQFFNAKTLVDNVAALMIEEKDLDAKHLKTTIEALLSDDDRRANLSKNARAMAVDNAIEDIIGKVEELWKQ